VSGNTIALKKLHRFFPYRKTQNKLLGGNRMSEEIISPAFDHIIKSISKKPDRKDSNIFYTLTMGLSVRISVTRPKSGAYRVVLEK
jgi:hypothetical protein